MSRTSLHRPRRPRVVWDRPATGTRLFTCPFPPNIPHYKRCPKAHRLRFRSDQSSFRPVPVTGYGRFPDKKRLALSKGQCQVRAPTHPAQHPRPLGRRPRARRQVAHQGHRAQRLHRRCPRRGHATRRRQRVHAPISPYGWALLVVETAPHRDPLASLPRPLRSTGLSQSRRRCGTSAMADNTHRYRRHRLPAQPSGPSIPSHSPAPSIQGKADFSRKTIKPHAWVRASIKTPPFIPTKGTAQQPIPQPLPPQLNNRRP